MTDNDEKEFEKEFKEFYNKTISPEEQKVQEKYWELIGPHLDKTEEEMKRDIPEGAYNISSGGFVMWTGKGGLIMLIQAMQKELKSIKDGTGKI